MQSSCYSEPYFDYRKYTVLFERWCPGTWRNFPCSARVIRWVYSAGPGCKREYLEKEKEDMTGMGV